MARLFVDANTLISGLLFPGNERRLLELGRLGLCELVTVEHVVEEVRDFLRRERPLAHPRQAVALRVLWRSVSVLPDPPDGALRTARGRLPDPEDAAVLAGFEASGCDALVTGDHGLRRAVPGATSTRKVLRALLKELGSA